MSMFLGFEKPTAIQQRAIKQIAKGRDIIAQAQPGSGKTAAFCTGVLQMVAPNKREPQALILSPIPEQAIQIQKVKVASTFMNIPMSANAR